MCLELQSGMTPWESENSSAGFSEGLSGAVAAAVAAVTQPQQRQQQQLVSVRIFLKLLKVPQIKVLMSIDPEYHVRFSHNLKQ